MGTRQKQLLWLSAGLLFCLLLYFKPLFLDQALFWRDITSLYHPLFAFVRQSLQHGEIPLWNPFLFSGTPLLAGAEPAIFYPGNLLFWLLDFRQAYLFSLILHQLWAAVGMYCSGRNLGWRQEARLLAALAFAFSGVMVSMNNFYPLLATAVWIPWIFNAAWGLLYRPERRWNYALWLALCLGVQMLSGHLEIVYITGLFLLPNFLLMAVALQKRQQNTAPTIQWPQASLALLLSGLLALLIASIQIWPSLELLQLSGRVSQGFAQASQTWSLHPLSLFALLIPGFHGHLFSNNHLGIFLAEPQFGRSFFFLSHDGGLITFVLAIIGLHTGLANAKDRPLLLGWALSALFALLLALGTHTPLYGWLLQGLPGLSFFRYPVKFLLPVFFFLSLLAAYGLEQILKDKSVLRPASPYLLVWTGLLALGTFSLQFQLSDTVHHLWSWLEKLYGSPLSKAYRPLILALFKDLKGHLLLASLLSLGLWLFIRVCQRRPQLPSHFASVLLLALGLELLLSGQQTLWTQKGPDWEKTSALVREIQQDLVTAQNPHQNPPRILHNDTASMVLPPDLQAKYPHRPHLAMQAALQRQSRSDLPLLAGLPDAGGYLPGRTRQSDRILDLYHQPQLSAHSKDQLEALMGVCYLLNGSGPKGALTQRLQANPKTYQLLGPAKQPYAQVWKRRWSLPRAYFRDQAFVVQDPEKIFYALSHPAEIGFDVRQQVLLEDNSAYRAALKAVPKVSVPQPQALQPQFTALHNNSLSLSLESDRSGYLVLADQAYPGWKAYDNGQTVPLLKANYFQRALRLGPGSHRIEFRFEPRSFVWGRWISGLTLLLMLLLLGLTGTPKRFSFGQTSPEPEPQPDNMVS